MISYRHHHLVVDIGENFKFSKINRAIGILYNNAKLSFNGGEKNGIFLRKFIRKFISDQ